MRKSIELADIVREHGEEFKKTHSLTKKQKSVLSAIALCRTEKLGFHRDRCNECGHQELHYNSCRDRHCPKCQSVAQHKWVNNRIKQILPVPYYHVVFTLPSDLFPLTIYNKRQIYDLLFNAAASTLKIFGRDERWLGGKIGFFGILHTWGQTLWHHPHVHFIVVGGAVRDNTWIAPKHKGKFLFPVHALSQVFRAIFLRRFKKLIATNEISFPVFQEPGCKVDMHSLLHRLAAKNWVVYCKSPMKKPEHVLRYIGRYTHRVAISNSRILDSENGKVHFSYKDYRQKCMTNKRMILPFNGFLQRFLWHVLPEKYHRIRHYGFLANGAAKKMHALILALLQIEGEKLEPESHVIHCPVCEKGIMILCQLVTASGLTITPRSGFV